MKALMVDVDGVVVTSPDGRLWNWNAMVDIGLDPLVFQAKFFEPHWQDLVLGRADLHDRLGPVLTEIAPHLTSQQVSDYWFANDAHLDHALLADLATLRASGIPIYLATVQEHYRARYLWDVLGLSECFDGMFYAAELGAAKPDPCFYLEIESRSGFSAAELTLLDDRMDNVNAARACGWGGVHWDGTQGLFKTLDFPR